MVPSSVISEIRIVQNLGVSTSSTKRACSSLTVLGMRLGALSKDGNDRCVWLWCFLVGDNRDVPDQVVSNGVAYWLLTSLYVGGGLILANPSSTPARRHQLNSNITRTEHIHPSVFMLCRCYVDAMFMIIGKDSVLSWKKFTVNLVNQCQN